MMKKQKCRVCGCRFHVNRQMIYTVDIGAVTRNLDAADCPHCGCQVALAIRFLRFNINPDFDDQSDRFADITIPPFLMKKHG